MDDGLLVAIDPGREKCGIALLDARTAAVLDQQVALRSRLTEQLLAYYQRGARLAVVGHRTASREIVDEAKQLGYRVELINEDFSTEQARVRYWESNPRCGWRRLIPQGLLLPSRPVDDYVAVILGERYLKR